MSRSNKAYMNDGERGRTLIGYMAYTHGYNDSDRAKIKQALSRRFDEIYTCESQLLHLAREYSDNPKEVVSIFSALLELQYRVAPLRLGVSTFQKEWIAYAKEKIRVIDSGVITPADARSARMRDRQLADHDTDDILQTLRNIHPDRAF